MKMKPLWLWAQVIIVVGTLAGMAIAIVKDGKVIAANGYGVRKLGDPTPVDGKTLFEVASNSKAFTAAALAMLVDEGKLAWDDPVTKHLPDFQMFDSYVTGAMTVRDLLTHRSGLGLGAGDLLWWPTTSFSTDEIIARLRYVKPATSFRNSYAYDNLLYIVAGKIIAAKAALGAAASRDRVRFASLARFKGGLSPTIVVRRPTEATIAAIMARIALPISCGAEPRADLV